MVENKNVGTKLHGTVSSTLELMQVTQRMKTILLRNTEQRQNVFVQHFVTLNS